MIDKSEKELDPVEQSAFYINQAHKDFGRIILSLSSKKKKSVSRILEAVLFEPLEEVPLFGKEEKELFDICKEIMYHKGIIMNYSFERMREKEKQGEQKEK